MQLIRRDDNVIEFLTAATLTQKLAVSVKTTVEFDGFVWVEMTVNPLAKDAGINTLQFEIPLDIERAKYWGGIRRRLFSIWGRSAAAPAGIIRVTTRLRCG